MEQNDLEEEEFGFSRNYFLAKELCSSGKKSARKVSDVNLVDEQVVWEFLKYYCVIFNSIMEKNEFLCWFCRN